MLAEAPRIEGKSCEGVVEFSVGVLLPLLLGFDFVADVPCKGMLHSGLVGKLPTFAKANCGSNQLSFLAMSVPVMIYEPIWLARDISAWARPHQDLLEEDLLIVEDDNLLLVMGPSALINRHNEEHV
ncbi:hypothetical protein QQP08_000954 [Theobroma cacao]|nr:hypothetical protein QQP08_000954 [Theobroma cacao]